MPAGDYSLYDISSALFLTEYFQYYSRSYSYIRLENDEKHI